MADAPGTDVMERAREALGAGALEEAARLAGLAAGAAEQRGDGRAGAHAERLRAQALRQLGRYTEAIEASERAAACARAAGDACLAAQVQIVRIEALNYLGRCDEAVALARRLERVLRAEGAEEDAARVLVNAGNLHYRRDRYAQALSCYERAETILAGCGDATALARVQANRANVLTLLNRVDEALDLSVSARALFAGENRTLEAAMVDFNVGYIHYISGRHVLALAAMNRARAVLAERNLVVETAKCDADRADVYRALNLDPEALEAYTQAIQTFAERGLVYERARAELGQAAILARSGDGEAALLALDGAEALFRAHRNALQRAYVRLVRAHALGAAGRVAEACEEAERAARTLARAGIADGAAEARFVSAEAAFAAGQDARRRMQGITRVARRTARGWLECRAERALGLFHARRGRTARALRHLRAAARALESARTLVAPEELHVAFVRDKLAVYEDLVGILLARGRPADIAESLEVVERAKSRLLLERVQAALENRGVAPATDEAASPLQERLAALRAELSRGFHRIHSHDGAAGDTRRLAGTDPDASVNALLPLERAYGSLLREIELAGLAKKTDAGPDVPALPSVVPPAALRPALAPDETLVEFYVVNGAVCAWMLRRDGMEVRRNLAALPAVAHAARRLRYHLQKAGMVAAGNGAYAACHHRQLCAGVTDVLRDLYDLLLRPLADGMTTEKVVLVPHGILHGLPFHAFFDGAEHALDRWEFVVAPSAALWHAGVRRRARQGKACGENPLANALLVGVPGPGIEQVAVEVERLARLLPCPSVLRGERATLAEFRARAGASRVIHLATHALFRADNPLFSGLRFADGWLLARDLYEMSLRADLVTLSACRTGVTGVEPGDELFGLLRGFLSAGARSLAASLWPADDRATAALMTRFYALLAGGGMSRAAALRAAQRDTREQFPHPYHWAAFALVGER